MLRRILEDLDIAGLPTRPKKEHFIGYVARRHSPFGKYKNILLSSLSKLLFLVMLTNLINCLPSTLSAQDSLGTFKAVPIDSLPAKKIKKKFSFKNYLKEGYPSPKKAITLAIIPGMGQIYNKKYWKLPLVYGALGGVIYAIDWNTKKYNQFRKTYDAKTVEGSMYEDTLPGIPPAAVRAARDSYDKNRQLSWIGVFGFYLISAGDAFVDAHLKDFNMNDDISFKPSLQTGNLHPTTIGLTIEIQLNK